MRQRTRGYAEGDPPGVTIMSNCTVSPFRIPEFLASIRGTSNEPRSVRTLISLRSTSVTVPYIVVRWTAAGGAVTTVVVDGAGTTVVAGGGAGVTTVAGGGGATTVTGAGGGVTTTVEDGVA